MSETSLEDAITRTILAEEGGYLINPSSEVLQTAIDALDGEGTLNVIVEESMFKQATDDFILATSVAEGLQNETVNIRTTTGTTNHNLFVTEDKMFSFVETPTGEIQDLEGSSGDEVVSEYETLFAESEEASLRVPARNTLIETLADEVSPAVADGFEEIMDSMESISRKGDFNEVAVILLLAAQEQQLLYEVSQWGEYNNLASKATFSRTKTALEDGGYIVTEKVPIEVGRPRLRLNLSDEEATASEIAETLVAQASN